MLHAPYVGHAHPATFHFTCVKALEGSFVPDIDEMGGWSVLRT